MKNIILFITLLSGSVPVMAQQQAKKRGIIMEQIAGLAIYGKSVAKGYEIARDGLQTAHSFKDGSFNLHEAFIDSLGAVSSYVGDNPKVKEIPKIYQRIKNAFDRELSWQQAEAIMSATEITYLKKVRDNLLSGCNDNLVELKQVTQNGQLQMTDAERMDRIDKLYADMQDKNAFATAYISKTHSLTIARKQDRQERQRLKKWYGIQ